MEEKGKIRWNFVFFISLHCKPAQLTLQRNCVWKYQLKTRFLENTSSDNIFWKWKPLCTTVRVCDIHLKCQINYPLFINWKFLLKLCLIYRLKSSENKIWKTFGKIWAYVVESRSTGHPHTEEIVINNWAKEKSYFYWLSKLNVEAGPFEPKWIFPCLILYNNLSAHPPIPPKLEMDDSTKYESFAAQIRILREGWLCKIIWHNSQYKWYMHHSTYGEFLAHFHFCGFTLAN